MCGKVQERHLRKVRKDVLKVHIVFNCFEFTTETFFLMKKATDLSCVSFMFSSVAPENIE